LNTEPNFNDILELEDVKGIMVLSNEGQVLFRDIPDPKLARGNPDSMNWASFLEALDGIREADFVFEQCRLYVRESAGGYLLVLMGHFAPIAMVRLNCDIVLPSLKQAHASKGLARFFKRKK
jgi:hypothetical protein